MLGSQVCTASYGSMNIFNVTELHSYTEGWGWSSVEQLLPRCTRSSSTPSTAKKTTQIMVTRPLFHLLQKPGASASARKGREGKQAWEAHKSWVHLEKHLHPRLPVPGHVCRSPAFCLQSFIIFLHTGLTHHFSDTILCSLLPTVYI